MDTRTDDLAVSAVELRRHNHPGGRGHSDGRDGWSSQPAARMEAVCFSGTSHSLPPPSHRHAVFFGDNGEERATSEGDDDDSSLWNFSSDDDADYANMSEIEMMMELQKREKVRKHIVEELVSTEQSYIKKLSFLKKMKERLEDFNSTKFIMPPEDVDKIFPLIDSLHKFHSESLLPALMLALQNWNHQSSIGHVFLIHEPKLQMYEQYIKASRRSAMTMETWRKKDPDFNTLITIFQQNAATNKIDILDIIHEPYIKLQRWKLLLQRYKQHLPPDCEYMQDYQDIPRILSKFDAILRNCEDALKQAENLGMLLDLEKKIEGLIVFLSSDTQFIKDGPVVEVDPRCLRICLKPIKRNETQRHLFLFNDMMLLCTAKQRNKKFSVRSRIPLLSVKLLPAHGLAKMGYESDRGFTLQATKKAFHLLLASSSENEQWLKLIRTAQHHAGQRSTIRQTMVETSCSDFTRAPIWIPDTAADSCMLCCRDFNLVCWRHHCRGCGIIMCSHCSPAKLRLPYDPSSPAIVCRSCHLRARRFCAHLLVDAEVKDSDCGADNEQYVALRSDSFNDEDVCV